MHIILWVKCMDKKDRESNFNHLVEINERKTLVVSGVKKLDSFDSKEFFLESVMGYILIKGQDLELIKLDTWEGTLSIKGKINSFNYLDNGGKKAKEESVLSKLFK